MQCTVHHCGMNATRASRWIPRRTCGLTTPKAAAKAQGNRVKLAIIPSAGAFNLRQPMEGSAHQFLISVLLQRSPRQVFLISVPLQRSPRQVFLISVPLRRSPGQVFLISVPQRRSLGADRMSGCLFEKRHTGARRLRCSSIGRSWRQSVELRGAHCARPFGRLRRGNQGMAKVVIQARKLGKEFTNDMHT